MANSIERVSLYGDKPLILAEEDGAMSIEGDFAREPLEMYGHTLYPHLNHVRYLQSVYGPGVRDITRYLSYMQQTEAYKDGDTLTATTQWHEWLGPDVQLALHEPHTSRIARSIVMHSSQLDTVGQQGDTLIFTALHHDKGEALVGDIDYTQKTDAHEADEARAVKTVIEDVFPEYPSQLTDELVAVTWEPQTPEQRRLYFAFNIVERIGYLDTALKAAKVALYGDVSTVDRAALLTLATEVSGRHWEVLLQAENDLPAIAHYLSRVRGAAETVADLQLKID